MFLHSLVKDFLTELKITTQNRQSAHKFKYETSTSHERKASPLAQNDVVDAVVPTAQKDPPLSPEGVENMRGHFFSEDISPFPAPFIYSSPISPS